MSVDKHSTEAKALAQKVAESMFAVDIATKDTMGMTILSCEPGRAVLRMTVRRIAFERPPNLSWWFYFHAG